MGGQTLRIDSKKSGIRDYLYITAGVFLYAFAGKNLYGSLGLVTGGLTGISVILRGLFRIPQWLSMVFMNIPLLLWGLRDKGWGFLERTVFAIAGQTVFLAVIPDIAVVQEGDLFLGALYGGVLMGAGCALIFSGRATGGGTDLVAVLLQNSFLRNMSVPQIIRILDWSVVIFGAGIFGLSPAMYALVSVYVMTRVSDYLLNGLHKVKAMLIVSEARDEIAERLMKELNRGVTSIRATGMYLQKETGILYCVMSRHQVAQAKDIVEECDPHAFVIILDAGEALGRGFSEEKQAKERDMEAVS